MKYLLFTLPALLVANVALAAESGGSSGSGGLTGNDATADGIGNLVENSITLINDYLLPLVLGLAFLVFIWGVFKYFVLGGSDEEKQSEGKSLIIYAVTGFVIIVSFYGIVNLLMDALGFDNSDDAPSEFQDFDTGINVR